MTLQSIPDIITGIIGSAIFYILLQLFKKFGKWFISYLSKVNKRFSNYLYQNLSIGNPIEPLLSLLIFFPILLIMNVLIYQQTFRNTELLNNNQLLSWNRIMTDELSHINETLTLLKSRTIVKNDSVLKRLYGIQDKQKEYLMDTDKKLQKNNIKIETYQRKIESLFLTLLSISFFILIFFYFKYLIYRFIINQKRNFEYKLTILRPYITEKEYYELKKNWNLITSKEDFKKVNDSIEKYFSKYVNK